MCALRKNAPQYEKIKNKIIDDIKNGRLKSGAAAPSENQIIRRFGVSSTTARRALNELVTMGFVRRIQGKGSFVLPPEERPGNSKIDVNYMVFVPGQKKFSQSNSYDSNLIAGIYEATFMRNINLIFKDSNDIDEADVWTEVRQKDVAGIIWERPDEKYFGLIKRLEENGIPQVTISRTVGQVPSVYFDIRASLGNTIPFLTRIGHRDIGFVDLKMPQPIFKQRQAFIRDELKMMGIVDVEKYLVLLDYDASENAIMNALDNMPPITALVVLSPDIKIIKKWAARKNLKIPDDLSIIAVMSEKSSSVSESLTTSILVEPRREIGKKAVEFLDLQCADKKLNSSSALVPGKLIMRESCSIPLAAKQALA